VSLILFTNVFDGYVSGFEEALVEPQYAMVGILAAFAAVHSGLAYLRPWGAPPIIILFCLASAPLQSSCAAASPTIGPRVHWHLPPHPHRAHMLPSSAPPRQCESPGVLAGESVIGARAWRVLFAGISLPLATVALFYFINHRYDGAMLWDIRGTPGLHTALWIANFVSFLFLYPSTFNLLEVAAVDKPELHLWESGVMRITRHPQARTCGHALIGMHALPARALRSCTCGRAASRASRATRRRAPCIMRITRDPQARTVSVLQRTNAPAYVA
jgi:NnrU protein